MQNPSIPALPARPPRSIALAALIIVLFMALFVLEITDSIVFHRQVARSVFFFPPTALLLWGVLTRRRWAWYAARVATALGTLPFLTAAIAAAWFFPAMKGRNQIGVVSVSLILASLLAVAFIALGRPAVRNLFQIGGHHEQ